MSRVGRKAVEIPKNVEVSYSNKQLKVKGPQGELEYVLNDGIDLKIDEGSLSVLADYANSTQLRTLMGTTRALVANMVTGVSVGFQKKLNLVGVGYRASVSGQKIDLSLGYSHSVKFEVPKDVKAKMEGNTTILLDSCDKQLLGQTAVKIRALRPPEPYKGKGILIEGEKLIRKAGKAGKK